MVLNLKNNKRELVMYLLIPLMSAIIGSLVTLFFTPSMEKVRFSFWKKQRAEEVKFILFEKRIDNIVEYQNASIKLRRCTNKYTAPEYRNSSSYLEKYCSNELDQIWAATFKAGIIFNEETADQIDDLKSSLFKLLMKSSLNMQNPTNYVNEVFDNLDKTLDLLQKNLNEY